MVTSVKAARKFPNREAAKKWAKWRLGFKPYSVVAAGGVFVIIVSGPGGLGYIGE